MSTSVLIVERPGQFRDVLLREVNQRGAQVHVRDDAMDALAAIAQLQPNVILVSDDPGPPGAISLCRLLQRKLESAAVYRLGEPSSNENFDERSLLLPRAVSPAMIADVLVEPQQPAAAAAWATHRAWNAPLGSLELGPLLLAIGSRWLTGRLVLTRSGIEREIVVVRGAAVHARSSVLAERLGPLGLRHGMFNETQLEQALDLAQARGLRLGEALLELGALDAPRLFQLLSHQFLEQLSAACNAGASHARFVLDHGAALRSPLLRLHPLTALLHAVRQTPGEDTERVLNELAERALSSEAVPQTVLQWLAELAGDETSRLATQVGSVRGLRERLAEKLPASSELPPGSSDAVCLALLRSGAFRMAGRTSMVPTDLRAGIRTLSPPSIAAAVVRCAHSSFDDWPVTALSRAHTPLEQSIDEYLHGRRAPALARALCLQGPAAECDPAHAEIYALYLRACGSTQPFPSLEGARGAGFAEMRTRCHELGKRVDALEERANAPLARMQLWQVRAQLERTLGLLPKWDAAVSGKPPRPPQTPPIPPAALRSSLKPEAASARIESPRPAPATATAAPDAALLASVEPLVHQGKWQELRGLLAARAGDAQTLPPVLALLYAIALKEDERGAAIGGDGKPSAHAEQLGIRAVSQLLAMPEDSATAIVIAKRTLRMRRPLDWNQKPPARVSLLLVIAALLAGAFVGLLLHPSILNLFWK
jgi:hypothetical protein